MSNYEYVRDLTPESPDWAHEMLAKEIDRRDAEIERLRALVKSAYKEGWLSGSLAGRSWETSSSIDWVRSEAKKTLTGKEDVQ